jgi:2-hydroxychromene-2-carboxylate isomerase
MTRSALAFYFDYISPFSYLASLRVEALAARLGREVEPVPVLFAALLNHFGHVGPAEIEPKRRWAFKRALRRADQLGVPLSPPPHHPFNPLVALRVTLSAPDAQRWPIIHALFDAAWARGAAIEHEADVRAALGGLVDVDSLLAAAYSEPTKEALRAVTARAITQGVFGVPTCVLDGELYWGEDTLDDLLIDAEGGRPQPDPRLERWLATTPTVTRRRPSAREPG